MAQRTRIKLSNEIDEEMKYRIKRAVKTIILQRYGTFVAFCADFNKYLDSMGKRTNFTDRVLSNKLNRGDIRFYEVLQIVDFLNCKLIFDFNYREQTMRI